MENKDAWISKDGVLISSMPDGDLTIDDWQEIGAYNKKTGRRKQFKPCNFNKSIDRLSLQAGRFNALNNSWDGEAYKWALENNHPIPTHIARYYGN